LEVEQEGRATGAVVNGIRERGKDRNEIREEKK